MFFSLVKQGREEDQVEYITDKMLKTKLPAQVTKHMLTKGMKDLKQKQKFPLKFCREKRPSSAIPIVKNESLERQKEGQSKIKQLKKEQKLNMLRFTIDVKNKKSG